MTVTTGTGTGKPDLLFLTQRIPYPADKGEKIRYLPILRHLLQSHRVHLGCLVDDPRDLPHVPTVRAMVADAHFATLNPRRAKIACLRGLLTGEALSVTYFRDAGLAAWVDRVLREVRPKVVFVCSSNMAPYVLDHPFRPAVRIIDLCDVDSEKWRAYAAAGRGPMGWVHRREWRLTAALERRIAAECDWSTFVSRMEAALFTRLVPEAAAKVRAISNGVDHGFFDPASDRPNPFETPGPNIVFTGTMDYPPNIDAAGWFAREVLPVIRRSRPDAVFTVVGSKPAAEVMALAAPGQVVVTGRVADVRPYLAHADVVVAPMRIARGIQNKVLEAMAMARPVVVTPQALEGIDATPGQEVLLSADTPQDFSSACLQALASPGLGEAARRRVIADYDWPQRLRGFDALLAG